MRPPRMIFTVQRELADRHASPPGQKSYSSFSVLCQSCFTVTGRGDLQPGSFYPVPDVVSSIVQMVPIPGAPGGRELEALSGLARALFSSRRKTIRNNAKDEAVREALRQEGVDLGLRAERDCPGGHMSRLGPAAYRSFISLRVASRAARFFGTMAHMGRR